MRKTITIQLFKDETSLKDFTIEYDDTTATEAELLKERLTEHQLIFSELLCGLDKISFIDSPNQTTLYISSLDGLKSYLDNKINSIQTKVQNEIPLTNPEETATFLRGLLIDLFQSLDIKLENTAEQQFFQGKVNSIYDVLAAHYYKEPEDYLKYLLSDSKVAKEELFYWFNEQERFNLLNQLLTEQHQLLFQFDDKEEIRDPFLLKYLPNINEKLEKEILQLPILETDHNFECPKLSKEELYSLTKEFLKVSTQLENGQKNLNFTMIIKLFMLRKMKIITLNGVVFAIMMNM